MNEIEAKMKVDDLDVIRRRLKSARAKTAGDRLETNIFFDTPKDSLRRTDKGLRLRTHRDMKTGKTEFVVTYKGPRQKGKLKIRQEIEFKVDDPAATTAALAALGFQISISFQKRRTMFRLQKCEVALDDLPCLGTFVEIEGPTSAAVMRVRKLLQLNKEALISDSYASMMSRYLSDLTRIFHQPESPSRNGRIG
jgi:adenylate cyclase class 2